VWTNGELSVGDAIIKGKLWTRLCGHMKIHGAEFSVLSALDLLTHAVWRLEYEKSGRSFEFSS
jgi:hypothetical protein